jgi:hypothetical protein
MVPVIKIGAGWEPYKHRSGIIPVAFHYLGMVIDGQVFTVEFFENFFGFIKVFLVFAGIVDFYLGQEVVAHGWEFRRF